MPLVSRKKRRAVIHENGGSQNLDDLPTMLPKWIAPVEPATEPLFAFQMRPRSRTDDHRHLGRIKRFCANAKSTVSRKFLMLQYSSDPQQQQQLSTEVVLEIDAILTRQQMQLFPTAVDEHLQQMEEASKEEEEARSFSATWNFSHIANKVIAARRQVRSDRSSRRLSSSKSLASLAPQDDQDRLRHSQESLNADVELESTASVLSRAQELATKCMQSIVTVASSLSEDTLPSYPGADLSSAATVLGFELKTVAGSGKLSHRHAQSLADAASHQRMFFILRFDLREFRKVETTSRSWPVEPTVEAALQALATPRRQRGRSTDAIPSSEAVIVPAPTNDQAGAAGASLLRDRAKEVLAATDRDLLRKARRRIRLESLRSLTVKRSLTALSAFHTALCQLLASVDIDPPPFPDTFLFGAVEEAALSHQSQLQTLTPRPATGSGSGGIQRLWSRWFSDATVPATPPTTPSAVATVLAAEPVSPPTPSAVEPSPMSIPSTPSSENFKDVCDQLQNYLTDVLALYEHVDEMLATLPPDGDDADAPGTVRAIAMVAVTTASDTGALRGRAASSDVQLSSDVSSTAKAAKASPPSLQPTESLPRSRESKSTSDLPAVAEATLADVSVREVAREPLAPPRQPPLSKLSRAAAALAQLLRELLIASDASEAQIGAFILRTTDEKTARHKVGSPTPHLAAGRTFWAAAVPPVALTVHFSGGSFGNAPTRGGHSRNETDDPTDAAEDAELWSDNDSVAGGDAPEARYRPIGTADSRRGHQNLLKSYDEADLLRVQLSRCLGCGETLSSSLFGLGKNYAMCHFFGALFCRRWCHGGDSRPIPMRVLHQWDCRPRKVCKLAAVFIDRVRDLPVVRVREANPLLLEGVPKLKRTLAVQQVLRSGMLPRALWADAETLFGLITELLPRRSHLVLADGLFALDDLLAIESERMRHLLQVLTEALLQLHQQDASDEQTAAAVVLVLSANSSDHDRGSLPTAL